MILWFLPDRSEIGTTAGLIVIATLMVYPVLSIPYIRKAVGIYKAARLTVGIVVIVIAVCYFGLLVWPTQGLRELTFEQRRKFVDTLKIQSDPIVVHLMCPPGDERDCAVASQFIRVFEECGWHVKGKRIDRVYNGSPKNGFYFVLHSTADVDFSKPGTGVWTTMPGSYYIAKRAFDDLIKTDLVVGFGYPENELGIYFGSGTAAR